MLLLAKTNPGSTASIGLGLAKIHLSRNFAQAVGVGMARAFKFEALNRTSANMI